MTAYCELTCSECGAFLATQNNDSRKREEVAAAWSNLYKVEIKPELAPDARKNLEEIRSENRTA